MSAQRDTERSLLSDQRDDLFAHPHSKCAQLAKVYEAKGTSSQAAWTVAKELTMHNAFAAHVDAEPGIDPAALINPWHAGAASATWFIIGALFLLVAIILAPGGALVPATAVVVVLALVITGTISQLWVTANA